MPSAVADNSPTVKVLVAGGSYAGLSTVVNLLDLGDGLSPRASPEPYAHHPDLAKVDFQITLVDERDGFFHLIGSPLALADATYARKVWLPYHEIPALQVPNVTVLHGSVSSVDCAGKTATVVDHGTGAATSHGYDYFVCATGLRRRWPVAPQSPTRDRYLLETAAHIRAVSGAGDAVVVVVGGGAVGIEMAAELKTAQPQTRVVLAHSRDQLLSSEPLPVECGVRSLELLREAGVEVLLGHRLAKTETIETFEKRSKYGLEFTNGHRMEADEVIMAISLPTPTTQYLPSSALNDNGEVKMLPNMSFAPGTANAESHFCAGDAADKAGIRRAGGALHGGHYVARNIHQSITEGVTGRKAEYTERGEPRAVIGLAIGRKAVASGPQGTKSGEDVMRDLFGDDLGFEICCKFLRLGGKTTTV